MTLSNTNSILPTGVLQEPAGNTAETKEQNVTLTINERVLEMLALEDININQLFVLLAMDEDKIGLLDQYDDHNNKRKVLLLDYQDLQIHGFLSQSGSESNVMFDITNKGREFVSLIKHYFENQEEVKETDAEIRKLAEEYLNLFPKIKLPSGKYARVAIPEIEKKLKTFKRTYKPSFKKYYGFPLTNEDILEATKNYIDRYAKKGYQFMVTSSYFIQKNEKSALADEIIAMKQGLAKTTDKFEKQL